MDLLACINWHKVSGFWSPCGNVTVIIFQAFLREPWHFLMQKSFVVIHPDFMISLLLSSILILWLDEVGGAFLPIRCNLWMGGCAPVDGSLIPVLYTYKWTVCLFAGFENDEWVWNVKRKETNATMALMVPPVATQHGWHIQLHGLRSLIVNDSTVW
jgi:hypothetical protein